MNVMACKKGSAGAKVKVAVDGNVIEVGGNGTLLGSYALECDSAYWEVKIGPNPSNIRIGVKRFDSKSPVSLEDGLADEEGSFILKGESLEK